MSSDGAQPEKVPTTQRHGLDVTAMTASFTFKTDKTVSVTVDVTGSGTDAANFRLYGASNQANPSTVANDADLLSGSGATSSSRPTRLTGSGSYTDNKDYTTEVTYSKGGNAVKWFYTVPAASVPDHSSQRSFSDNSMTKRS
jgi:hypothetical protein